jgi:hypothetical protein
MGIGELHTGFWWSNLRERNNLKDPGVDGRITSKSTFEMCDEGLDSIGLTHDRNKWQAVVHRTKHLH